MKILPDRIGFDFDGVIADIGETFIRLACDNYGYCSLKVEEITSFQVEHCTDIPIAIVQSIFNQILEDSIGTGLKPIPGAIETLSMLAQYSEVTVITARSEIDPVKEWFNHYCDKQERSRLKLIATGDHDNKEEYIKGYGLTHFIDDRTLTCIQLAEAGLNPIVFTQPWNHNQHDLPVVKSWQEISQLIDFTSTMPLSA